MNKLKHLYEQIVSEEYIDSFDEGGHTQLDIEEIAIKSAEITAVIATNFIMWCTNNCNYYFKENGWKIGHIDYAEKIFSTQELFNEFITNHYGK